MDEEDGRAFEFCTTFTSVEAVVAVVRRGRCRNAFATVESKITACWEIEMVTTAILAVPAIATEGKFTSAGHFSR